MDRERVRNSILMSSIICSVVFLSLLSLSPIVFAWDEVSYSGEWTARTRTYWGARVGQGVGESAWECNYTFEGYEASINFTQFHNYKAAWWHLQSNKKVILLWNFSNIYVYINFLEQHNLWGWVEDRWVQVGYSENSTDFTTKADFWWNPFAIQTSRDDFLNFPSYVKVVVDKVSATEVNIVVLNCRQDTTNSVLMCNATYDVGAGWFANTNLTFSIYHEGYGLFYGGMSDTLHESVFNPSIGDTEAIKGFGIWDFVDNLIGGVTNVLPTWLKDNLGMISGWFGWLIGAIPFLSTFVGVVIPVLPYFFLFWILDAVGTCMTRHEISPLGVCMSTILHYGASAVDVLVGIMHAIYDFIHFW